MSNYLPLCGYFASKVGGSDFVRQRPYLDFTRSKDFWTSFNCAAGVSAALFPFALVSDNLGYGLLHFSVTSFALGASLFVSDIYMPRKLEQWGVGVKNGGQILRAAQIGSFVAPVALSLGVHWAIAQGDENKAEPVAIDNPSETVFILDSDEAASVAPYVTPS